MTPRERILAALNHEIPDRTPTEGWFHPEVMQMLKAHYHTDSWTEVLTELGIVGWATVGCAPDRGTEEGIELSDCEFASKASPRPASKDGPFAIWTDEYTYENYWGVKFRIGDDDRYKEWVYGPLQNIETVNDLDQYTFPTGDNIIKPKNYARQIAELKSQDQFVMADITNPFKTAYYLRGMINFLTDYGGNDEFLEAMYDKLYAFATEVALCHTRAGVDMIRSFGDIAMQDRMMIRPESWRKYDKPRWAKLIATCRQVNPQLLFFFHSDGNITDIIGDLVDIDFDVLNPLQPECLDPFEIKRQWGNNLALHGGVSLQRTLPFGSTDDVRNETEALIKGCGYNGGYVLCSSNVIQPDTPVENIIACFHAAHDYDLAS